MSYLPTTPEIQDPDIVVVPRRYGFTEVGAIVAWDFALAPRITYLLEVGIARSKAETLYMLGCGFFSEPKFDRRKLKRARARAKRRVYLEWKRSGKFNG